MNNFRIHLYPVYQNQKQKSAESDQGLHYLLKIPEKMILLMTGYHDEPIATGSIIKRCNFLMKLDNFEDVQGKLYS